MTKEKREVVKSVENATLFSDGTILLKNVRASYPHIFKPSAFEGGEPSYSIMALMPKDTHDKAKKLIDSQVAKLSAEAKIKVAADKVFCRDGDQSDRAEAEGMWTVSAREKKRPIVRDKDKSTVDSADADKFYGGCWVNLLIRPWVQNNQFGKRVNANFVAVQFVRDDEAFGEGRISDDEIDSTFDSVDPGSDDDDI